MSKKTGTRKKFYSEVILAVKAVIAEKCINRLATKAAKLDPRWSKEACLQEVKDWLNNEMLHHYEWQLEEMILERWKEIEGDILAILKNHT